MIFSATDICLYTIVFERSTLTSALLNSPGRGSCREGEVSRKVFPPTRRKRSLMTLESHSSLLLRLILARREAEQAGTWTASSLSTSSPILAMSSRVISGSPQTRPKTVDFSRDRSRLVQSAALMRTPRAGSHVRGRSIWSARCT